MRRLIASVLVVLALCVPLTYAQTADLDAPVDNTSASEPVLDTSRIQQRVEFYKISLSSNERKRLVQRCVSAQSRLSAIRAKAALSTDKRRQTYHNITALVTGMVARLNAQGVTTDEVQKPLQNIQNKMTKFESDYASYQNALDDARLLDCQANPEGFKAALEDARAQRKSLLVAMQDIHELALTDLRDSLIDTSLTMNQTKGTSDGN